MVLISVEGVGKYFSDLPVLSDVTFDVRAGDHIALVGPNGCGKTTLLNILSGQLEPDRGQLNRDQSVRIGFLKQQGHFSPGLTVWDQARDALRDLFALVAEAEQAADALGTELDPIQRQRLEQRYDQLQDRLSERDGYYLDHRIERVLQGLGFPSETYQQPVEQLSGGEQNRLRLACLLLHEPDVMLLDEPSNHLDIDTTHWLEVFLAEAPQALIVVSHDRFFLDRVANRTLELFRGTVDDYRGNYSAYARQKTERVAVQRRTYQKQQQEMARMADFIRRHHHGQKHAQAEDRRKKLQRITPVPPPREITAPTMGFRAKQRSGEIVVRVEHLSMAFTESLFDDLTFDILRGEKWGILGPNGSGKTTLLRCLLGHQSPDTGNVNHGTGIEIAYFDQLLTCLDDQTSAVDAIRPSHRELHEPQRRNLLARFGIVGDMAFQKVHRLSGGERNRVALAMLAASEGNVLALDEPTNHLDLWARDSLERSLVEAEATALFVSHDRYFLNQVADHLLVSRDGNFHVVHGNYDTFETLNASRAETPATSPSEAGVQPRLGDSQPEGHTRKRRFPFRKTDALEADIVAAEARIIELQYSLASPEVARDGERVKTTQRELRAQKQALAILYEHWEEAFDLNG